MDPAPASQGLESLDALALRELQQLLGDLTKERRAREALDQKISGASM